MELLERFAQGDVEAFECLFRQFQGEVYGWIVRIVRNREVAEDLTVETFWHIHRAHARFNPSGNFGGWARRIATNLAFDSLRKNRRETDLPNDLAGPGSPDPAVQHETRKQIQSAFRQLPARLHIVAILALVEELPYAEIATALGISEGAVRVRVFRATRALRKSLKEQGVEA
jgi:RNA polymerase sigma-70 factor (ECF subfamily)